MVGARLAVPRSSIFDIWISDHARALRLTDSMTWIGINDIYVEGNFVDEYGNALGYSQSLKSFDAKFQIFP